MILSAARIGWLATLAGVLLLSGCAYVDVQPVAVHPPPAPGKALVYFFRVPEAIGSSSGFRVGIDEAGVGALVDGSYTFAQVPPGRRVLWAETEKRDAVEADLVAGETYFVRVSPGPGIWAPRPHLDLAKPRDGKRDVAPLRYVLPAYPWTTDPPRYHGPGQWSS